LHIAIVVVFVHSTYQASCLSEFYAIPLINDGNNIGYYTVNQAVQKLRVLTLEGRAGCRPVKEECNGCNDVVIVELGGIGFYRHEIGCVKVV